MNNEFQDNWFGTDDLAPNQKDEAPKTASSFSLRHKKRAIPVTPTF